MASVAQPRDRGSVMARARNIKPSFFTNDSLAEVDPLGRLLFQGLWCHADREGRLEDRPRKLKAEILPYDNCDVEGLLADLDRHGFISRYEVDGRRFIQVVNFAKHQNPHIKEAASEIPAQGEHGASTVQVKCDTGTSPADSLIPHPSSLNPHPSSLKTSAKPRGEEYPVEFEAAWAAYPPRAGGASKRDAFKAWAARVKGGADPEAILAGVKRYAAYCVQSKTEPRYVKMPATFFGPGEHFKEAWEAPKRTGSPRVYHDISGMDYTQGVDADGRF